MAKLVELDKSKMKYPDKDVLVDEFKRLKKDIEKTVDYSLDKLILNYIRGLYPFSSPSPFMKGIYSQSAYDEVKKHFVKNFVVPYDDCVLVEIPVDSTAPLKNIIIDILYLRIVFFGNIEYSRNYNGITDALKTRIAGHKDDERINLDKYMVGFKCSNAELAADIEYVFDRVFGIRSSDKVNDDYLDWGHGGDEDSKVIYLFERSRKNLNHSCQ